MLLLNKENLEIRKVASKDHVGLMGVHITPTHTVATDGKVLATVSVPTIPDGGPPHPAGKPVQPYPDLEPCTISIKAAEQITKLLPKPRQCNASWHATAVVNTEESNTGNRFHAVIATRESRAPFETAKEEHLFPDYSAVLADINAKEPMFKIAFNADLLIKALQVAKAVNGNLNGCYYVELAFADPNSAVKITTSNRQTGQEATVIVMPLKLS